MRPGDNIMCHAFPPYPAGRLPLPSRSGEPGRFDDEEWAFRLQAFRNAGTRDPIGYAERPEFSEARITPFSAETTE